MIWNPWVAIRRRDNAIAALRKMVRIYEGHAIDYVQNGNDQAIRQIGELRLRDRQNINGGECRFVDSIIRGRLEGRAA